MLGTASPSSSGNITLPASCNAHQSGSALRADRSTSGSLSERIGSQSGSQIGSQIGSQVGSQIGSKIGSLTEESQIRITDRIADRIFRLVLQNRISDRISDRIRSSRADRSQSGSLSDRIAAIGIADRISIGFSRSDLRSDLNRITDRI